MADQFMTISQISRRLDVSRLAISRWCDGSCKTRRPLPVVCKPVGKSHRFGITEQQLLAYLEEYRPDLGSKWLMQQT